MFSKSPHIFEWLIHIGLNEKTIQRKGNKLSNQQTNTKQKSSELGGPGSSAGFRLPSHVSSSLLRDLG